MIKLVEPEAVGHIENQGLAVSDPQPKIRIPLLQPMVALLTGGSDRPYVLGLVEALTSVNIFVEVIGSNELSLPELLSNPRVNFLNFRGDQSSDASFFNKAFRITKYYWRIIRYAAVAKPRIFHILWNNKFELFDRTLLLLYYRAMSRRVVLTAHNVNMRKRDGTDTWLNRFSLRIQYHLVDCIFVHTNQMKQELLDDFGVAAGKVKVIPFGINNTSPTTGISLVEAKRRLNVRPTEKTILCFGQIAPYKGLEYLVEAFSALTQKDSSYRLIIAGKPKWNERYWRRIEQLINDRGVKDCIICRIGHVPDGETEIYFKAADVLVLSYVEVFQSGVIFLAYSFGLPVIAADVGSLKESIVEARTGFVFQPKNSIDLTRKIEKYFASTLFANMNTSRADIQAYANENNSWRKVATITTNIYTDLLSADR
jgi:glycosyltransferase involved in cell wall biosynthesis